MADINSMIINIENNMKHSDKLRDDLIGKLREAKFTLDNFYNEEFSNLKDEDGVSIDTSSMTEQEKYRYLKATNAVGEVDNKEEDPTFKNRYEDEVNKINDSIALFKETAADILRLKLSLIEANKKQLKKIQEEGIGKNNDNIAKLKEEIEKNNRQNETEKEKIQKLKQEIQEILVERSIDTEQFKTVNEEIKKLKIEFDKIDQDIQNKEAEYVAESDPDKKQKLHEELQILSKQKSGKQIEIDQKELMKKDIKYNIDKSFETKDSKNNELKDLESNTLKINESNIEKNEKIMEIQLKNTKFASDIKRLEEANEKFSESLQNDFKLFEKEFGDKGIGVRFSLENSKEFSDINIGAYKIKDETQKGDENNNTQTENNNSNNDSQTKNNSNNNQQQSSSMPISGKLSNIKNATDAMENFKDLYPNEKKYVLDNFSYNDLSEAIDSMGIFARRRLASDLQDHIDNSMPESADFEDAIAKIAPSYNMSLQSLCDKKGNLLPLNKLDLDQLDDIQGILDEFSKNRSKLSQEEIESFENNFMNPIRNNEIFQKAKTGRIKGLFNSTTNGERTDIGKAVVNNISDYYTEKKEQLSNNQKQNSGFFKGLEDGVETEPNKKRNSPTKERDKNKDINNQR